MTAHRITPSNPLHRLEAENTPNALTRTVPCPPYSLEKARQRLRRTQRLHKSLEILCDHLTAQGGSK